MSEFSNILHTLRTERGITQKELARLLGVSYSTISMYERGHRQPDLEMLVKLANVFGISVDSFLGRDADGTASPVSGESPIYAALQQFARQKNISYEEALRWFTQGDSSSVMYLRDPDGLVTPPLIPSPSHPETPPLTPHEQAVILAYRQRPEVRPFVDKLLDIKD